MNKKTNFILIIFMFLFFLIYAANKADAKIVSGYVDQYGKQIQVNDIKVGKYKGRRIDAKFAKVLINSLKLIRTHPLLVLDFREFIVKVASGNYTRHHVNKRVSHRYHSFVWENDRGEPAIGLHRSLYGETYVQFPTSIEVEDKKYAADKADAKIVSGYVDQSGKQIQVNDIKVGKYKGRRIDAKFAKVLINSLKLIRTHPLLVLDFREFIAKVASGNYTRHHVNKRVSHRYHSFVWENDRGEPAIGLHRSLYGETYVQFPTSIEVADKKVQFEAHLIKEQGEFDDDIPQIFAKIKPAQIDNSKWLFVIGIENYSETDKVNYSKRSAEWFKKVAAKTLGIRDRQAYVLIDEKATSASIKDRLKLMLRNVQKGDKIYFYYSGHGIPVYPTHDPYILASDKIPDFVNDDEFFKVENIYKYLSDSNASQVVAFMDSCFTGNTDGRSVFRGDKAPISITVKNVGFDRKKMAVITAGTNTQFSNVFKEKGHRLFSYYLMKSLLKGRKNINRLHKDVYMNVRNESKELGDMNLQEPVVQGNENIEL